MVTQQMEHDTSVVHNEEAGILPLIEPTSLTKEAAWRKLQLQKLRAFSDRESPRDLYSSSFRLGKTSC